MENEFGESEAIEGNRRVNAEALRRARMRNADAEPATTVSGITPEPEQQATDFNAYTSAEHAPAQPQSGALNWGGGMYETSPLTPPAPNSFGRGLTSAPRCDQGQRSGVDDIVRGS